MSPMTNNAYPFYLQLYQQVKILNYWSKWELQKYITRGVTGVKLLPVSCRLVIVRPLGTNIPWLNESVDAGPTGYPAKKREDLV